MFHICLHICNICRIIYLTHVCLFSGNAQTCACNTYGVVYLSVLFVELICFLLWIHYDVLRFQNVLYMRKANDLHIHIKCFTCANQMTEWVMAIKQWVFTWNLSCLPDLFTILGHQHIYERIHATYMHHICKTWFFFSSWYMIHIW